ncbi:MAG: hypothetical protein QF473_06240 [Planctomycetota bacterium]|jgi:hypothetical protein|nr:hypothetical protein [Planctomycetota bacterium]
MEISLLIPILLVSTPLRAEKSKIHKQYDKDGNIEKSIEEVESPNGKFRGIIREYYPNGFIRSATPIVESAGELGYAPDGISKRYVQNQQLASSVRWSVGKRHGPLKLYYSNGDLRESGEFKNDKSCVSKRSSRSGKPLNLKPSMHVDLKLREVVLDGEITVFVDNYYDTHIHFGWMFAYKLVEENWERVFKRLRGDNLGSRQTETVVFKATELGVGKWKIAFTYDIPGPGNFGRYIEATSEPFKIEPCAPAKP